MTGSVCIHAFGSSWISHDDYERWNHDYIGGKIANWHENE